MLPVSAQSFPKRTSGHRVEELADVVAVVLSHLGGLFALHLPLVHPAGLLGRLQRLSFHLPIGGRQLRLQLHLQLGVEVGKAIQCCL